MIETGCVVKIGEQCPIESVRGATLPVVSGGSVAITVCRGGLRFTIPVSSVDEVFARFRDDIYGEFVASRLKQMESLQENVLHCALGCGTESGELMSTAKKLWAYQKPMGLAELDNLVEEAGDVLFYLVGLCNVIGVTLSEVAERNRMKLIKRYPSGYSNEAAIARADKGGADADN